MERRLAGLTLGLALISCACSRGRLAPDVEARSLLGEPLRAPRLPAATREAYDARLAEAARTAAEQPHETDALIWLGRRTAYLGRYREAIAIYTRALAEHPTDARLYRHRGHRWLTVREPRRAVADLERAARLVRGRPDEVEPDGLPNARGIPTSTLQTNIWYHLALAWYVQGRFDRAAAAWDSCLRLATNPDMRVAASYWYYLTLSRLGRTAAAQALLAPIRTDLDIIENRSYHRLLLLYAGRLPLDSLRPAGGTASALDDATLGYGVGAWHLIASRPTDADAAFRRVLAGGNWPAFGYLAAEAELARRTTTGGERR